MSTIRLVPFRKNCPPEVKKSLVKAKNCRNLFLVQELGPLAFIIKETNEFENVTGESDSLNESEARRASEITDSVASSSSIIGEGSSSNFQAASISSASPSLKKENMHISSSSASLSSSSCCSSKTGPKTDLKFRVALGQLNQCTCPYSSMRSELCYHILWVMLKVMRLSEDNEILYQRSLIDREISELLSSRQRIMMARSRQMEQTVVKDKNCLEEGVTPRSLDGEDICPICQDELLSNNEGAEDGKKSAKQLPLTFCKFSCGNHVHVNCMKLVMDHQLKVNKGKFSSFSPDHPINCPYCRGVFGRLKELTQRLLIASQRDKSNSLKLSMGEHEKRTAQTHIGVKCSQCSKTPIVGTLYRCRTCRSRFKSLQQQQQLADYSSFSQKSATNMGNNFYVNFCENCFLQTATSDHASHLVEYKKQRRLGWRLFISSGMAPLLPEPLINDLQSRDLTEADYDLLVNLTSASNVLSSQSPISLGRIGGAITNGAGTALQGTSSSSSSLRRLRINVMPQKFCEIKNFRQRPGDESVCKCCLERLKGTDLVRSLTCGHVYHLKCIDDWVIKNRASCPVDGFSIPTSASWTSTSSGSSSMGSSSALKRSSMKKFHSNSTRNASSSSPHPPGATANILDLSTALTTRSVTIKSFATRQQHQDGSHGSSSPMFGGVDLRASGNGEKSNCSSPTHNKRADCAIEDPNSDRFKGLEALLTTRSYQYISNSVMGEVGNSEDNNPSNGMPMPAIESIRSDLEQASLWREGKLPAFPKRSSVVSMINSGRSSIPNEKPKRRPSNPSANNVNDSLIVPPIVDGINITGKNLGKLDPKA